MAKLKNCFNSTIGSGDEIKSFLATNNGGLLTSTTNGGKEALDVHIAGSDINIDVALDGIYNAGTNTDPDNVGVIFHDRAAAPDDTNQSFRSTGASGYSADILAAALANVFAIDTNAFLYGLDDTGNARAINVDADGDLQVDLKGVTLASKSDSLKVIDTNETMTASSGTAAVAPATITALTNQSRVWVQNTGDDDILVNGSWPLPCGAYFDFPMCDDITVEAPSGSPTYEVLQFAT